MDILQQELADLYKIAEWAIFYGHNEIVKQTLVDITERGGAIPAESLLEQRLNFYGCKAALTSDNGCLEKLSDGLEFFDTLNKTYEKKCLSAATNGCQWVRIRQHIVMQLAILKLKRQLSIGDSDIPAELKDITIPSSFNSKLFCEEIEAHFVGSVLHPLRSTLGKLAVEYNECFKSIIVGVFDSNFHASKIKYRLLFLLHSYTIASFRLETTAFLRSVEREVLPAPIAPSSLSAIMVPPTEHGDAPTALPVAPPSTCASVDVDAAAAAQHTMRKLQRADWSEDRKATKGPYAPKTASPMEEETKKSQPKRPRILREIDADGDETDEQGEQEEGGSVQKARRNGQVQHASDRASSAVQAANALAANRKHFVGAMEGHDPLAEALGVANLQEAQSVVGERKTKARQASATAVDDMTEVQDNKGSRSASKKSPANKTRKKSLMESRAGASTVNFSDFDSDSDSQQDSKIAGQRSRIEVGRKTSFPEKLVPSSSAAAIRHRRPAPRGARVFWTADEEDALRAAVATHGPGNWAQMLDDPNVNYRFQNRTTVNLKDKYRNMLKADAI